MSNVSYGITALILQVKNQAHFCPATRSDRDFSWGLEQCMCKPASSSASVYLQIHSLHLFVCLLPTEIKTEYEKAIVTI